MKIKAYKRKKRILKALRFAAVTAGICGVICVVGAEGGVMGDSLELAEGVRWILAGSAAVMAGLALYTTAAYLDRQITRRRFKEIWKE